MLLVQVAELMLVVGWGGVVSSGGIRHKTKNSDNFPLWVGNGDGKGIGFERLPPEVKATW